MAIGDWPLDTMMIDVARRNGPFGADTIDRYPIAKLKRCQDDSSRGRGKSAHVVRRATRSPRDQPSTRLC